MTTPAFSVYLLAGAAALALWAHVRFPRLAPPGWRTVMLHLATGMLALNIVAPAVMKAIVAQAHETPVSLIAAAIGVALPGLTYVLLSCIWFLSLAQRMMSGLR